MESIGNINFQHHTQIKENGFEGVHIQDVSKSPISYKELEKLVSSPCVTTNVYIFITTGSM